LNCCAIFDMYELVNFYFGFRPARTG
jgi:hypothetical protein